MSIARFIAPLMLLASLVGADDRAAPPQLYRQTAYESPVRGDPDDLLLLAGYGFAADDSVVYRAVPNHTAPMAAPGGMPEHSTADLGLAPIVSSEDVPYSLTIRLPQIMRADQTYELWVHTARGEWSKAVKINDARPLWISPAYVYASNALASLPRELKIVGRNLQPDSRHTTKIRLVGPELFAGTAITDARSSETLNHYVARVRLPPHLTPGSYRVQVSRDGESWVEIHGQVLVVLADEKPSLEFSVSDPKFGQCRPDDGADDTGCILRAIAAAKAAGGGSIMFGPGTWDLIDGVQPGLVPGEGIVVAPGVQLRGAGSALTRVQRHKEWNAKGATAAFTLVGNTRVSGFTFRDLQKYEPSDQAGPYLQLGADYERFESLPGGSVRPADVDEVVITENIFDKPFIAIASGGLPIKRLSITYNTFGAYYSALELNVNRLNSPYRFRIDDSVVDFNVFEPGSMLDSIHKIGTLASELGAGDRVDFSGNLADGASTDYLYAPGDARGWRAAFFWNTNDSVEDVLVSQNTATCTGDKIGDGEAIAFDNNGNTFAFGSAPTVIRSTSDSFAVSAPLALKQHNRDVPAGYYVGHWVQIMSGPGLGQARKIVGYETDSSTHLTTFRIAPDWDVVPIQGRTRIGVGHQFWHLYALDNVVDNRQPLCQKSNRSRNSTGVIVMWAQSADSVIEGNHQYDSSGIFIQQSYLIPEHPCVNCTMQSYFQSFLEIRANAIDGEYDWATDCSASGIALGVAVAPWGDTAPPTVGFGVSISHNTIRHADALRGGAIAQMNSWYVGPEPHRWPLSDNVLIHHNSIGDVQGARAMPICDTGHPRIGIAFPDPPIAWRTVLYANSCKNVFMPVGSGGVDTVEVCPSSASDPCECQRTTK